MSTQPDDFEDGLIWIVVILASPLWVPIWLPAWIVGRTIRAIREARTPRAANTQEPDKPTAEVAAQVSQPIREAK